MVSGTTALDEEGKVVGKDDMYSQTVVIIKKIEAALGQLGATLSDVVRTRVYARDISRWREIARAHREFFGAVKPTSTLVEVQKLIEPEALVEIEAEAIIETRVQGFMQWLEQRSVVPLIRHLHTQADALRRVELERAQKMLARGAAAMIGHE